MSIEAAELVRRIWAKDPNVWVKAEAGAAVHRDIVDRLGWLRVASAMEAKAADIAGFAREVKAAGFNRAVLLGMGGSSLAPLVFRKVCGATSGIELEVADTTDPAAVRAIEKGGDIAKTLFIVSSKSGGTIEVDSLYRYFFQATGGKGAQFIAITDPGTALEKMARENSFRRTFINPPDIGGRFSALSLFGLVPAALIGVDVAVLLARTVKMMRECDLSAPGRNPGLQLGLSMARAWETGRDKVTLVADSVLEPLGLWVEQLVAESTGKNGRGIVPVALEPLGGPGSYSADRLFVSVSMKDDATVEAKLSALEGAGHPVVRLRMNDALDLGAELFRWEFATAVAGAVMEINPFDQPNVQEAKIKTKEALAELAANGKLPEPPSGDQAKSVRESLASLNPGKDYIALLAFLPYDAETEKTLRGLQEYLRDRFKVAVTWGFGPRYLHSTGQLHKGGANNGVFFVLAGAHAQDLAIPGVPFSFGQLERAQALGDRLSLEGKGRRVAWIGLPDSSPAAVAQAVALFRQ
jgi:glucose-6-phosphate isomerase